MNTESQIQSIADTPFIVSPDISNNGDEQTRPTPIKLIAEQDFASWQSSLDAEQQAWLTRQGCKGAPGDIAWLSGVVVNDVEADDEACVIVCHDGQDNLSTLGALPMQLPEGQYALVDSVSDLQVIGWGLGGYQFTRYKQAKREPAQLVLPEANNADKVVHTTLATALTRDLINTSAQDMAPSHLEAEILALAGAFGASCEVTLDDALLDLECGAIHAVGRAADDPPRLIDLQWGDENAPKVTLVGKGVTFDSGGLNIKGGNNMRLMKKDMGGAANVIGLAYLIMAQHLPVRLRLLVPAAENAIAGNAFRPGDVLNTHKGLTVEIDNTDAEGRLLLCDALSIACEDEPDLLLDYATLTGSARSAVGAELAAMFCNDNDLANALGEIGNTTDDPVWRMPLHQGYNYMLKSKVADLVNSAASPFGGAITAALYLQHFVSAPRWVHFDIMAFNTRSRPGHPEGGEAMGLRAVYEYLEQTYGPA